MALVEGHIVINVQTLQFQKAGDCALKFPIVTFTLHCYVSAIATMRGGGDGLPGQENWG